MREESQMSLKIAPAPVRKSISSPGGWPGILEAFAAAAA